MITEATVSPEQMLREFHAAKAVHNGLMPSAPTADIPDWVRDLRMALLDEEVEELREAIGEGDIVKIADALGDIEHVTRGTAVAYGIPSDAVFAEIFRSNMTKDNSPAEGKLVKGPRYEPPRIAEILGVDHVAVSRYGWNCDVCGRPVSGRTDEHGASVRHVRNDEADDRAADAWAAAHGE